MSWYAAITGLLFLTVISCSGGNAPSDEQVKTAIRENVESHLPDDWTPGLTEGVFVPSQIKNIKVESVEIKEQSNFNEEGRYLPVRAGVSGTFQIVRLTTETVTLDKLGHFRVKRDDFWKAEFDTKP